MEALATYMTEIGKLGPADRAASQRTPRCAGERMSTGRAQRSGRAPAAQRSVAVLYSANESLFGYPPPKTTVLPQEPPPTPAAPDADGNAFFVVQASDSGEYISCLARAADGGEPAPRT